jgi:hypothetical protein
MAIGPSLPQEGQACGRGRCAGGAEAATADLTEDLKRTILQWIVAWCPFCRSLRPAVESNAMACELGLPSEHSSPA